MSSSDAPAGLQLERMLDDLIHRLVNADNGPDVRAALIEARRLKNVAMRWAAIPPPPDARREMIARVMELSESVDGAKHTSPGSFTSTPPPPISRPASDRRGDQVTGPHQPFPRSPRKLETGGRAPYQSPAKVTQPQSPSPPKAVEPARKAPPPSPPPPSPGPQSPVAPDLDEEVKVPKPAPVPKIETRGKPLTLRPPSVVEMDQKKDEPFDRAGSSSPRTAEKARPIQAVGSVRGAALEGLSSTISSAKIPATRPSSIPAPPPTRPSTGSPPRADEKASVPRSVPPGPPPRRAPPPPLPRRASTQIPAVTASPPSSRPPVLSATPTPLPPSPGDVSVALADGVTLVRPSSAEWQPHPLWPGTSVKLLSHEGERGDYTALVRLSRGAALPRRRHVGIEEMWMVEGVAMIGEVELRSGEYVRADAGTEHPAIRSVAGCTFFIRGNENDEMLPEGRSGRPDR